MLEKNIQALYENYSKSQRALSNQEVIEWFKHILSLLLPERFPGKEVTYEAFKVNLSNCQNGFETLLNKLEITDSNRISDSLFNQLTEVIAQLNKDIIATDSGDPAAKNEEEIRQAYPGLYAIAAHRIAHILYLEKVPIIPRIIAEYAHGLTGIDIHPGAQIGEYFCIDHGTGVVIGETTIIGNHVKIYQGVTIGALSVNKADASVKRHPTIEDNVIIYAGATILGGETIVGKGSIIGGNVWLTQSVTENSRIYYNNKS